MPPEPFTVTVPLAIQGQLVLVTVNVPLTLDGCETIADITLTQPVASWIFTLCVPAFNELNEGEETNEPVVANL